ncbi:glycosyl hydrolase 53 family protein [Thalassobellus suaedae]|uniref:Arabinogalactan endo-beta-1,4-galactanase n=1 Tax=Thalassobellus suaedae TaxID=3074124 RepID=A0ABY9XP00_9FLAO|nr:glycosyl hydrolase 53 family protein [Flavobacteriaceae bacterium HL-DH14]
MKTKSYLIQPTNVLVLLFFLLVVLLNSSCATKPSPFSIGADISFIPQMEARGAAYYDSNNVKKDICLIMAENNFDNIRLRIFVNPEAENGYSRDGFCDLDHTIAMAKRIKAAGMKFTLDFHYSDTW